MLEVRDLTIEYTSGGYKVRPINDLTIDVESGELVLLLGASGCGKTTLLSALATLLTPTAGTIRVADVEVTSLRGPALVDYRRKTVGVVFQAFNLIPSLNARENVEVPLRAAEDGPRHEARARAVELLDHVGLTDRMDHRPGDLSGGQQQRVAIARALAHDPPLVLADEPTAHLDYIQVDGVLRLLRELAQPGRVVVVATHDERLLPLADRVVELSARAVADARPPAQVELTAGQVLFREGDPGDLVYVVEPARSSWSATSRPAARSWSTCRRRAATSASWRRCSVCAVPPPPAPASPAVVTGYTCATSAPARPSADAKLQWSQAVGLEEAEPDLAHRRERGDGVPERVERHLAGDRDRRRVEQLADVRAGERRTDHDPPRLVDDELPGPDGLVGTRRGRGDVRHLVRHGPHVVALFARGPLGESRPMRPAGR